MPRFSAASLAQLETVDLRLQRLMHDVIRQRDCKIDCGRRSREEQTRLFNARPPRTKVQWPNGNHNVLEPDDLARAVDAPPYPVVWGGKIALRGTLLKKPLDAILEDRYQAGFARGYLELGGEPLVWQGPASHLLSGDDPDLHRANLHALIRFYDFGGYVVGAAHRLGVPIRWGGDWDQDHDVFDDQTFQDLVHFEIPRGA